MDWSYGWERARAGEFWASPDYDDYCFPLDTKTTRHGGSLKFEPLDEILWAKEPGSYKTRCPCHDDNEASLSILILEDSDQILVNCFAGCDWREVKDYIKEHS